MNGIIRVQEIECQLQYVETVTFLHQSEWFCLNDNASTNWCQKRFPAHKPSKRRYIAHPQSSNHPLISKRRTLSPVLPVVPLTPSNDEQGTLDRLHRLEIL